MNEVHLSLPSLLNPELGASLRLDSTTNRYYNIEIVIAYDIFSPSEVVAAENAITEFRYSSPSQTPCLHPLCLLPDLSRSVNDIFIGGEFL